VFHKGSFRDKSEIHLEADFGELASGTCTEITDSFYLIRISIGVKPREVLAMLLWENLAMVGFGIVTGGGSPSGNTAGTQFAL
jgi:hypothetical protein